MDSLKELQSEIEQFNKDRDWDQFHSPANLAKSISIESGELLECFQWDENKYDKEEVNEELADVINYCLQMATVLGVDVKTIVEAKLAKNAKKYPVEKAKGVSTKYTKL
jgi:NTP pyrophosphatase (non-canonical NTP hydrolase)